MAIDKFAGETSSLGSPARGGFAITPSNSSDIQEGCRCLYVGTGGDIVATLVSGITLTFKNVPSGILPVRVIAVKATGTTASDILGLI